MRNILVSKIGGPAALAPRSEPAWSDAASCVEDRIRVPDDPLDPPVDGACPCDRSRVVRAPDGRPTQPVGGACPATATGMYAPPPTRANAAGRRRRTVRDHPGTAH